jgi:hypothetical protein
MPLKVIDPNKIKGYKLIKEQYANTFMVARKKSGKTTCIFKILKECSNKDTLLIFFGSTIHNDPGYEYIFNYFEKRGNPITKFTSIIGDGVDQLDEILTEFKEEAKRKKDEKNNPKKKQVSFISVDNDEEDDEPKKRKPKKIAPEVIFVFDDLSKSMRIPSFSLLLKSNRHYKSKVIISSQNVKDILPECRENIDVLILFKDIKEELLKTIYNDFNILSNYSTFINLYNDATRPKFSFLYIDMNDNEYRRNFNELYSEVEI